MGDLSSYVEKKFRMHFGMTLCPSPLCGSRVDSYDPLTHWLAYYRDNQKHIAMGREIIDYLAIKDLVSKEH